MPLLLRVVFATNQRLLTKKIRNPSHCPDCGFFILALVNLCTTHNDTTLMLGQFMQQASLSRIEGHRCGFWIVFEISIVKICFILQ